MPGAIGATVRASCVRASAQSPACRTVPGPSDRELHQSPGISVWAVAIVVSNRLARVAA